MNRTAAAMRVALTGRRQAAILAAGVAAVALAAVGCGDGGSSGGGTGGGSGVNVGGGREQISNPFGVVASASLAAPFAQLGGSGDDGSGVTPAIWVQGTASVDVAPDTAYVNFTVEAVRDSVREAQQDATGATDSIVEDVEALDGVDQVTTNFSIFPQYDYDESRRRSFISGYSASYRIRVTVNDVDDLGEAAAEVIAVGVAEGGDLLRLENIGFTRVNSSEQESEVRQAAARAARERAEDYAEALGISVGDVLYVTEVGFSTPVNFNTRTAAVGGAAFAEDAAFAAPSIQVGDVGISGSVQVAFAISQ